MWEFDYKERWTLKNWCFWCTKDGVGKESWEPLDCKGIKRVDPKGNHSWIVIGRTDAEAETPIFWPPDVKNWHTGKTLMLGNIEGRRTKGQQDEIGCHHWLDEHKFEQALGVGDGQGNLICCNLWDRKELDKTERLNCTDGLELADKIQILERGQQAGVPVDWVLQLTSDN